jgi:hypothetical protein
MNVDEGSTRRIGGGAGSAQACPDIAARSCRGYDDWVSDFFKAEFNRLFCMGNISLQNVDLAVFGKPDLRRPIVEPERLNHRKRITSEMFREQSFVSMEADEVTDLKRVMEKDLLRCIVRGSDYPHAGSHVANKVVLDNPRRFMGFA